MDGQIGYKMPISWPRTTTRRVVPGDRIAASVTTRSPKEPLGCLNHARSTREQAYT